MEINNLEPVTADNQFVYKMVVKVSEEYDKFVFETIKPYCEKRMRLEISKNELIEAIQKQRPVKPTWQNGKAYCGACGKRIPGKIKAHYCHKCGQKEDWT